jgi:hypothetical protein
MRVVTFTLVGSMKGMEKNIVSMTRQNKYIKDCASVIADLLNIQFDVEADTDIAKFPDNVAARSMIFGKLNAESQLILLHCKKIDELLGLFNSLPIKETEVANT